MPAVLHSLLVRGWLKVFASDLGMVSASCDADLHTWALSFHDMPALSQSDLVKGWPETSAFGAASNAEWDLASPVFAIHTFAFSSHAIAALSPSTRVNGWTEMSSANARFATRLPMIKKVIATSLTSSPP